MKNEKVKKTKTKFQKFLIVYSGLLGILMFAFLIYVGDSLIKYEKNQTDKFILNTLESACKNGVCSITGLNNLTKSDFDQDTSIESALEDLIKTADLKFEQTLDSREENPVFDIIANNQVVLQVELKSSKKINRLGLLSFYKWEDGIVSSKIENGFYTYKISVPNTYKVYVNDKELTSDFLDSGEQEEAYLEMSKYVTIPYMVTYKVENLYKVPQIVLKDDHDEVVAYEQAGNEIKKELEVTKIDTQEEALEKLENAPQILKIAEDWSLFLTQDLQGTLYGFYNLSHYLISDSSLYKYAKSWATGIDITFTSKHTLENPIFTNEKVNHFEIYSDSAFSCEVYLEKNMVIKGSKHQDVMHDRLYFVRLDGEWKLVNMQAITEG